MEINREYVRFISNDNLIFYIERNVAEQSEFVKKQIQGKYIFNIEFIDQVNPIEFKDIRGEVLEVVVDYLNHKIIGIEKAPKEFPVKDNLALDVLIASINLGC